MNIFKLLENPNCCINCMRSGMTPGDSLLWRMVILLYPHTIILQLSQSPSPMRTLWRRSLQPLQSPTKKMGILKHLVLQNILSLISCEKWPSPGPNTRPNCQGNRHIHQAPLSCLCLCPCHGPSLFQRNSDQWDHMRIVKGFQISLHTGTWNGRYIML